jgi:hypothetical protein
MGRKKIEARDPRIDRVRQQIEHWRQTRTRRSPMPEPLWRAAVELARELGVFGAARTLRVNYDSLRTRAEAAGVARRRPTQSASQLARFVEIGPMPMAMAGTSGPVVEVTGPSGQRLTVRLRGGELDLAALIRECWSGLQ